MVGQKTSQNLDNNNTVVSSDLNNAKSIDESSMIDSRDPISQPKDDDDQGVDGRCDQPAELRDGADKVVKNDLDGFDDNQKPVMAKSDMSELVDMLSKLNPMAQEFVPPSLAKNHCFGDNGFRYANNLGMLSPNGNANGNIKRKNSFNQGRKRTNNRRTVYVSDIDQQVTEEQLAGLFIHCGQVVDCRICGDPNSVLRFAFIEFTDQEGARVALNLSGTVLGYYPLRVLPSKTAIAPVNPTFLPQSEDEREMCARTIYCTNIDKKISQVDVRLFFESFCGEVQCLRLLGDYHHSTRIAFVEFAIAESAILSLNCSGAVLGSLPIRVSPSKTPVRPHSPRLSMQ